MSGPCHPAALPLTHCSPAASGPLSVGFMFENNTFTEYEVQTNQFFVAPAGVGVGGVN